MYSRPLNNTPHPSSLFTQLLALPFLLTQKQLTAFFFLLLLSGTYIKEASKLQTENDSKNKLDKSNFDAEIESICTNSKLNLKTFNKPNFRIDSINNGNQFIPASCLFRDADPSCQQQLVEYKNFQQDPSINLLRNQFIPEFEAWAKNSKKKTMIFTSSLTESEANIFREIYRFIFSVKQDHIYAKYAHFFNGGNCAEHTSTALIQLLKKSIQYATPLKVQMVELRNKIPPYYSHGFVLIKSNLADVEITNNPKAISNILTRMNGDICDPWNGYFNKATSNQYEMYTHKGNWETLSIKTIAFPFKQLSLLPKQAKEYICNELADMGFSNEINAQNACKMFKRPETSQTSTQTKTPDHSKSIRH